MAAPVESAVTSLSDLLNPGLIPSPTAQQLTAIQRWRGTVAGALRCPKRTYFAVVGAEIGRFFKVDEVLRRREFVSRVLRLEVARVSSVRCPVAAFIGVHHSGSTIKTVF